MTSNHTELTAMQVTVNQAPLLAPPQIITRTSSLHYGDIYELLAYPQLLENYKVQQLGRILKKTTDHPKSFNRGDFPYLPNTSLLVMGDYSKADDMSWCRIQRTFKLNCGVEDFCPYCSYRRRQGIIRSYVPSFDKAERLWFVTVSFKAHLSFSADKVLNCDTYWDSCGSAINALVDEQGAEGACWVEELAVPQFLPLRVLPHIHAIVASETEPDAEFIGNQVQTHKGFKGVTISAKPSIRIDSISTDGSMLNRLSYMFKPVKLADAYVTSWVQASANDRAEAWKLNAEVKDFATGYPVATHDRDRFRTRGCFHPASKSTLVVPEEDRDGYRDYLWQLQQPSQTVKDTTD